MAQLRFTIHGLRPGSAAESAENESAPAERPNFRIAAGSAARDAEQRKAAGMDPHVNGVTLSMRGTSRGVRPHSPVTQAIQNAGEEHAASYQRDRAEGEQAQALAHDENLQALRTTDAEGSSAPGALQYVANRVQSLLQKLIRPGDSV